MLYSEPNFKKLAPGQNVARFDQDLEYQFLGTPDGCLCTIIQNISKPTPEGNIINYRKVVGSHHIKYERED